MVAGQKKTWSNIEINAEMISGEMEDSKPDLDRCIFKESCAFLLIPDTSPGQSST